MLDEKIPSLLMVVGPMHDNSYIKGVDLVECKEVHKCYFPTFEWLWNMNGIFSGATEPHNPRTTAFP